MCTVCVRCEGEGERVARREHSVRSLRREHSAAEARLLSRTVWNKKKNNSYTVKVRLTWSTSRLCPTIYMRKQVNLGMRLRARTIDWEYVLYGSRSVWSGPLPEILTYYSSVSSLWSETMIFGLDSRLGYPRLAGFCSVSVCLCVYVLNRDNSQSGLKLRDGRPGEQGNINHTDINKGRCLPKPRMHPKWHYLLFSHSGPIPGSDPGRQGELYERSNTETTYSVTTSSNNVSRPPAFPAATTVY